MALGLGANLGDPRRQLLVALRQLEERVGPLQTASLYLTRPQSPISQPDFLNTAAVTVTDLHPEELLKICRDLEVDAGRRPGPRFGPRPLDIDILLYGSQVVRRRHLSIPHPRLLQRRFALEPLAELAAGWIVPGAGVTVGEALERVGQEDEVERVGW